MFLRLKKLKALKQLHGIVVASTVMIVWLALMYFDVRKQLPEEQLHINEATEATLKTRVFCIKQVLHHGEYFDALGMH